MRRPGSAEKAQFFGVFRSNGGKRDATVKCESRLRGRVKKNTKKHLCPAEQAQFSAFFQQTEAYRKQARRVSHARKEGYKKRKAKPAVPTPIVQAIFPQTPAETTTNMVLCRGNIFSKEMTVTSKHILQCERHLQEGDIFERK